MATTAYSEVSGVDTDVAAFMAAHVRDMNVWQLPLKMWVARQDDRVVAVLALNCIAYPSLDLTLADKASRPFMRVLRLWHMAEAWLVSLGVPLIAASIRDCDPHFQSLVRRYGFVKIGVERNDAGEQVETIFGKQLILDGQSHLQEGMVQ